MADENRANHRTLSVIVASLLLVVGAALAVIFAVLINRQVPGFVARAATVDPSGPDTQEYMSQARIGLRTIGIVEVVLALLFVACALTLLRPVRGLAGAPARRIGTMILAALGAIYPLIVALRGGVGFTVVAIPHEYNGDNAVHLKLLHSFQTTAVQLNGGISVLLILVIVLLALPTTARYFGKRKPELHGDSDYVSAYLQRKTESDPS